MKLSNRLIAVVALMGTAFGAMAQDQQIGVDAGQTTPFSLVRSMRDLPQLTEFGVYVLGVEVRKVTIPVAAGRNLAVLVEAAVRNYVLQLRGIDSAQEFFDRHQQEMEGYGATLEKPGSEP